MAISQLCLLALHFNDVLHFTCMYITTSILVHNACILLSTLFPGVETKFKGAFYEVLLSVSGVPELNRVEEEEEGLLVGAAVTLNTLSHQLTSTIDRLPG